MLGLHCCAGFSLAVVSAGYALVGVHGLHTEVAFLAAVRAPGTRASAVAASRLL